MAHAEHRGETMAKRHITARIEEGTAAALDRWAEAHGTGRSEAVERLLLAGMGAPQEAPGGRESAAVDVMDQTPTEGKAGPSAAPQGASGATVEAEALRETIDVLRASNTGLRATVSTLTAQLDVKDRQISRLADIADHAQALQAAQARTQLLEAAGAVDAQEGTQRQGWRARLARWIAGDKG